MQLFVPPIGTQFRLDADWTFPLYDESRNYDLWVSYFGEPPARDPKYAGHWYYSRFGDATQSKQLTLKSGTMLSVDRIYIRKGAKDFDSISFRVLKGSTGPTGRFWAKLHDVNYTMPSVTLL